MKAQTHPSDRELLQSMLAGDEEALAALYRRRQRGVYQFALQMCGSQALAEDVTQEVFMVLIREGHTFDSSRGSLSAFLMGVARNHVLRRLRRERFYVSMDEDSQNDALTNQAPETSAGPLDDLSRNETIESVRRSVLALPERYREVVVLCDLQEMSYAEAAEILGCAVGTVRSRLHRGRALLIEKLRPAIWSAMTGHRFGPRWLDAAFLLTSHSTRDWLRQVAADQSADRSAHSKEYEATSLPLRRRGFFLQLLIGR